MIKLIDKANAALIAAAPEMLDWLKTLESKLANDDTWADDALADLREIIANAEGEEK